MEKSLIMCINMPALYNLECLQAFKYIYNNCFTEIGTSDLERPHWYGLTWPDTQQGDYMFIPQCILYSYHHSYLWHAFVQLCFVETIMSMQLTKKKSCFLNLQMKWFTRANDYFWSSWWVWIVIIPSKKGISRLRWKYRLPKYEREYVS